MVRKILNFGSKQNNRRSPVEVRGVPNCPSALCQLTMPRSPTSSEDEMAQSCSDYSDDGASDSSQEETIYETIRATTEPPRSRMDDIHTNSLVVRVLIPDLQQTVSVGRMSMKLIQEI